MVAHVTPSSATATTVATALKRLNFFAASHFVIKIDHMGDVGPAYFDSEGETGIK